MDYADGADYEVEFVTLDGETISVLTVPASAARSVRAKENRPRADGRLNEWFRISVPPIYS